MIVHYTDPYLITPLHPVTVDLVGAGGTGSQVLSNMARINAALLGLGHPGLQVCCWDIDTVSESNIGRQLFSTADIGQNKAVVLVSRVNRFYGFEWQARAERYTGRQSSNILVTCVDTAAARLEIAGKLRKKEPAKDPYAKLIYWLDIGNLQKTGQVVLGTFQQILQPKQTEHPTRATLKTADKFLKLHQVKEEGQGPSCSLAEALTKQDLFINSTLAQFGCGLIWKLFREGMIRHHGCYVNLDSCIVNPIKIK